MYTVVGVSLDGSNKIYYFDINNFQLKKNQFVIVELDNGLGYGKVVVSPKTETKENLIFPLKKVLRIANKEDKEKYTRTRKESLNVIKKAKSIAAKLNLNMNFVDAHFTFDKTQLFIRYTADERIDFRELAKKLAQVYKTRIELRQIGVRDKAKQLGGLGPCGRMLCCSTFLSDFESVSINMAKNQYLSLSPTKINGVCGRLLCCLNYEDEIYTELKKTMPEIGSKYKTENGLGEVVEINLFKKYFLVETDDKIIERIDV